MLLSGGSQAVCKQTLGSLTRLAQAALATGANVQANADAIHNNALLVHIRAKIPACAALGETHIISESLGLATDITLPGHGLAPFNTYHIAQTRGPEISGSTGDARHSIRFALDDANRGTKRPPCRRRYNDES